MLVINALSDPSVASLLLAGQVGVLPTDTIYGLAVPARDQAAVAKLYACKTREHKPGTVIAANTAQLIALGLDATLVQSVAHLWPEPLSIVINAPAQLDYLTQDVGSLAVRIPADDQLRQLLQQTGPLLTSSANLPGQPPATIVAEAQAYFGDAVGMYVDGGNLANRPASTVVRLELDGSLTLLRQGGAVVDGETNNAQRPDVKYSAKQRK